MSGDLHTIVDSLLSLTDENLKRHAYLKRADIIDVYLNALTEEADEVKEELEKNNTVYLEDELGDVLWVYLMLLKLLVRDGLISSVEDVFQRSLEKFSERLEGVLDIDPEDEESEKRAAIWTAIKQRQKERLREEHKIRHGSGRADI